MTDLMESDQLEDPEFKWVTKGGLGGKNKKVQFYKSFTYDGLDYALYDCVYMHKQGEPAPYIGKLVKIWEMADGTKKIKVHWFFRPSEISHYLKDTKVSENELFFASGDGKGVYNINPLEAIAGKCNVVCTSADGRNPQPSPQELQMADYVFYRIFDVKSCTVSDQIDDKVGDLEVNFVFNQKEGPGEENELNVVALKETPKNVEIAGNSSFQQLNNTKLDKNGNHALEEVTQVMQVAVKQGSLDGKHVSGGDVISSKIEEITGSILEEKSTAGAKDVGSNIREKKDKVKDITVHVNQVHAEKGVKHARKSCDLDDAPSKRAKFDGSVSSNLNGVQSVKDSVECRKDVKLSNSSPLDEKLSKIGVSSSKDASRSGHVDAVTTKKKTKLNKDPNALQGKTNAILSSEKEKLGSTPRKDSLIGQKDKELGRNLSACGEKTSRIDVVSRDRPSTSNISPKEIPKSVPNNVPERSRQLAKPAQSLSLSDSVKKPLEITNGESKEMSKLDHDKSHANKEKNHVGKMKNSPKSLICDNNAKSKLGERPSLEYHNEKDNKLSNDNLPNPVATKPKDDGWKVGGKIIEVTPRPLEKTTWIKLPWEQQMKTANDQERLVLLQNLDPEYTSGEVEDIIWHIFREQCTARMLPHTAISNPYLEHLLGIPRVPNLRLFGILKRVSRLQPNDFVSSIFRNYASGQAFAVFKTRDAANKIVHKLDEGCLMLPNRRPLVAFHGVLPKLIEKRMTHVGHLVIENDRRQKKNREWKIAVSTSHYSQHNTIEFEMAMDWCLLQVRSDKWWKNLYELQRKELKRHVVNPKSK